MHASRFEESLIPLINHSFDIRILHISLRGLQLVQLSVYSAHIARRRVEGESCHSFIQDLGFDFVVRDEAVGEVDVVRDEVVEEGRPVLWVDVVGGEGGGVGESGWGAGGQDGEGVGEGYALGPVDGGTGGEV